MKTIHNPPELFNSTQYGFSQVVASSGGRTVRMSGQVAMDADENVLGGTIGEQMPHAMRNVEIALAAGGARLDDVVSMTIYFRADRIHETSAISETLRTFFPEKPPATSWIGVVTLSREAFLVELEAVAVVA